MDNILSTVEMDLCLSSSDDSDEEDSSVEEKRETTQVITTLPLAWLCFYKYIREDGRRESRWGNIPQQICPKPNYKTTFTNDDVEAKIRGGTSLEYVETTGDPQSIVSSPHCEIVTDRIGGYWIKDLNSKRGTFVNGKKLYHGCKQRLEHGDIISLGMALASVEDAKKMKDCVYVYEFQEKYEKLEKKHLQQSSEQWAPAIQSPTITASPIGTGLCNVPELHEDVISSICEYLPLEGLKTLRLVSRLWNRGATKIFKEKSKIRLTCSFSLEDRQRNSLFLEDMKKFDAVNILLEQSTTLQHFQGTSKSHSTLSTRPRIYEENIWLYTTFFKKIRSMHYSLNLNFVWEISFVRQVLESFPAMKDLSLCLWISSDLEIGDDGLVNMLQLQNSLVSLHRFRLCLPRVGPFTRYQHYLRLIPQLLSLMPNLKSLDLRSLNDWFIHHSIVKEILTLAPTLLPNLIELMLPLTSDSPNYPVPTLTFLQLALECRASLKTLEFSIFPISDKTVDIAQMLIEKNAATLQNLKMYFSQEFHPPFFRSSLRLPTLMQLKTLELDLNFRPCSCLPHFVVALVGFQGSIEYSRDMPMLNKFVIRMESNALEDGSLSSEDEDYLHSHNVRPSDWEHMFQNFFQNKQICTSLRHLELPEPPTWWDDKCDFNDCDYCLEKTWTNNVNDFREYSQLSKLFPNANNYFMNNVRRFL